MIDAVGNRTLGALLDELAEGKHSDAELTVEADDDSIQSLSYGELADATRRVASGFQSLGVRPGDRVLVQLPSSVEAITAWLALSRLGAIFVPCNTVFTGREIGHVVARSKPTLALASSATLGALEEGGMQLAQTVVIEGDASGARGTFDELLKSEERPVGHEPRSDDVVELVFTSGTTSLPKAAMITHANCLFSGLQKAAAIELSSNDRLLTALPIFHVNAQSALLAALTTGAPAVLLERYSASRYCPKLVAYEATVTSLVGTQVRTLLRQEPGDCDRVHGVRRAWFALNVRDEERRAFEWRFNMRLLNGYGLSEAFTSVAQVPLSGPDRWPSVGCPLLERRVRIADEAGVDVGVGEVGEILVGGVPGRTLMAGYWDDEAATAAALRDGWLHTGDFGRVDSAGYLYFVERKANMIKRAGENVAAGEVEDVLLEHAAVLEAAVVGVADPLRDEAVKAFVVLREGSSVSTEELEQHCAEFLAPFKVPTLWSFLDELPKSALGKIDHEELRGRVPTSATSAP